MLAIMCRQFGTPDVLVAEQQPSPRAGRGEVVMRVRAVALSGSLGVLLPVMMVGFS